jgi:hypothetical protein
MLVQKKAKSKVKKGRFHIFSDRRAHSKQTSNVQRIMKDYEDSFPLPSIIQTENIGFNTL